MLFHRSIDIKISSTRQGEFDIQTTLRDMYHDILLSLTVSLPDYRVANASVEMKKTPHQNCKAVYPLLATMVGKEVGPGFTKEVISALGGSAGCPNMVNLILLSAPLAINAAAVRKQQKENLTDDEMDAMWQDVLAGVCISYPSKKEGESA
jgi:hypothetical protein